MRVLVVYDSVFGNTEKAARAMGDAVKEPHGVKIVRIGDFAWDMLEGVDLLVVGSPTRAFRPTKAVVGMIRGIPADGLKNVRCAAFDTRTPAGDTDAKFLNAMMKLFGYAAEPIDKALRRHGGTSVITPEGFFVSGKEGPLRDGELERAARWMEGMLSS